MPKSPWRLTYGERQRLVQVGDPNRSTATLVAAIDFPEEPEATCRKAKRLAQVPTAAEETARVANARRLDASRAVVRKGAACLQEAGLRLFS